MSDTALEQPLSLGSFGTGLNVAVIGASGGLGQAFAQQLEECAAVSKVFRLARSATHVSMNDSRVIHVDYDDEATIADAAAEVAAAAEALHLVVVATGLLHDGARVQPEKTWRSLTADALTESFRVNALGPALVAKHFLPLLDKGRKTAFAALSARVGSIGDNRLGGWHAYRGAKAALNMLIRTLSIELAWRNPTALCVTLHPGTVQTALSEPFSGDIPPEKLFSPQLAARNLLAVLDTLGPEETGGLFAWDGSAIEF